MNGLSIFILIAIVFLAVVRYVNRSRGGEIRTPDQAQEDWQRRLRGTEAATPPASGGLLMLGRIERKPRSLRIPIKGSDHDPWLGEHSTGQENPQDRPDQEVRGRMEILKAAFRGVGRLIGQVRVLVSGEALQEAQRNRGDEEGHRPNAWPR